MNIPSNAVPGSPLDSQAIAPAAMSATRPMYWSVRRELWENRSIYIAPLVVAAVLLFGFLVSTIGLPERRRAVLRLGPAQQRAAIEVPYDMAAMMLIVTAFIVGVFYCLDALHGERHDRSILFWKSLPVSDLTTVLSKASIPLVVLPLLTFAITIVTQSIMLLISTAALIGSGRSVATMWNGLRWFEMSLGLLYHLLAIHSLWYAPIFGWLLLVSAWAKRAAFLWAALPPFAIGVVEKIAFNTSHFAAMLGNRMSGGEQGALYTATGISMPMTKASPLQFLFSPGMWIGLALAAAFLSAAVWLRRNR